MENTFDANLALAQASGADLWSDQPLNYDPSTNVFEQEAAVIAKAFNDESGVPDDTSYVGDNYGGGGGGNDGSQVQGSGHEVVHGGIAIDGRATSGTPIGDGMFCLPPSVEGKALRSANNISCVNDGFTSAGIWGEAINSFSSLFGVGDIAGGLYSPVVNIPVMLETNTTINLTNGRLSTTYMTYENQIGELDATTGFPHGFTGRKSGCLGGPLPGTSSPDAKGHFACPHRMCNGKVLSNLRHWTDHQWRLHGLRKSRVVTLKINQRTLRALKAIDDDKLADGYRRKERWNHLRGLI